MRGLDVVPSHIAPGTENITFKVLYSLVANIPYLSEVNNFVQHAPKIWSDLHLLWTVELSELRGC